MKSIVWRGIWNENTDKIHKIEYCWHRYSVNATLEIHGWRNRSNKIIETFQAERRRKKHQRNDCCFNNLIMALNTPSSCVYSSAANKLWWNIRTLDARACFFSFYQSCKRKRMDFLYAKTIHVKNRTKDNNDGLIFCHLKRTMWKGKILITTLYRQI